MNDFLDRSDPRKLGVGEQLRVIGQAQSKQESSKGLLAQLKNMVMGSENGNAKSSGNRTTSQTEWFSPKGDSYQYQWNGDTLRVATEQGKEVQTLEKEEVPSGHPSLRHRPTSSPKTQTGKKAGLMVQLSQLGNEALEEIQSAAYQDDDTIARTAATAADSVLPGSPSRRAVRRNQLAVLLGADTLTEEHLPNEMLSALRTLAKEGAARRGSIQYEDFAKHQNENYQLKTTKEGRQQEQQKGVQNPLPGVFTAPKGEHPFDNPFVALQYLNARQQVDQTDEGYRFHEQMGFEDTEAADSQSLLDVLQEVATTGTGSFYNVRDLLGKIGGTAQVEIKIPRQQSQRAR